MDSTVSISLPPEDARALLVRYGWGICMENTTRSYTRPGQLSRAEGGIFGRDYLWQADEALADALTASLLRAEA